MSVVAEVKPRQRQARRTVRDWREGRMAYIYLRVSTNMKTQLSIPDQEKIARAIAVKMGYTVIGVYIDEKSRGVRRDGLHDMLSALELNDNVGAVFFWQASRMWGHIEQQRRIQYRCQSLGVRLIDGKGKEYRSDTPMEILFNLISGGLNEFETNTTAERIYDTHRQKAADGKIITKPVYGVRNTKQVSADGQTITRSFTVDPDQMVIVRRIFREYADGVPAYAIAKALQADGVKTQQGNHWTAANIRRTLDNRFYIGEVIWNRTKTEWEIDPVTGDKLKTVAYREEKDYVHGTSPLGCILAEDPSDPASVAEAKRLFDACQNQRSTRGRERQVRKYDLRVLAGLIICGRCGYRMQAHRFAHRLASGERNPNFNFRCMHYTNANKGCSVSHGMTERQIHKKLRMLLSGVGSEVVSYHAAEKVGRLAWRMAGVAPAVDAATKDRARREIEKRKAAVNDVKANVRLGDFYDSREDGQEEMRLARAALAEAEAALRALEEAVDGDEALAGEVPLPEPQRALLEQLMDVIDDDGYDLEERRQLAYDAFESIVVDNPSVTVVWRRAA